MGGALRGKETPSRIILPYSIPCQQFQRHGRACEWALPARGLCQIKQLPLTL